MGKKYLQACEIGGSIYGKKRTTDKKKGPDESQAEEKDMLGSYSRLYRKQLAIMNKVFRHNR